MTAPTSPDVGRVVVDPRFRARRIAVRRDAGRRRLRRLLVLVAIAAVAGAGALVLHSPVLDIDRIAVAGTRNVDRAAITATAGLAAGDPILLSDLDAAERRVEAMPWVASATVTRDLPANVSIRVVERRPTAVVAAGDAAVLVDRSGRVLGDAPDHPLVPYVRVVTGGAVPAAGTTVDDAIAPAIRIAATVHDMPGSPVAAVHLEPSLRLDLADGGVVELGDEADLDTKVQAFRTVYARVDRSCLELLDVRVPTHPVLTRDPTC